MPYHKKVNAVAVEKYPGQPHEKFIKKWYN
jgi:hypothetical protein